MSAKKTVRLRLTSSVIPSTGLPNASSQKPPVVAARSSSVFAEAGTDLLYCLAKHLQPQDWARLRRISFQTMKALDACLYRYQVRPQVRSPLSPARAAPSPLAEGFNRLSLGAADLRPELALTDMVNALIEATAWNHLHLDFASFKQSDQSRFKELISCLLGALYRKPEGWRCHWEMDLRYCRQSLRDLLPRLAQSPHLGSLTVSCDTDPENMDFIAQAPDFERLQIALLETRDLPPLALALSQSRARIRHLVLDGMPPQGELSSVTGHLAGKGLQSLTIPQWSGASLYNQMGFRQAMAGFQFLSFAKLDLQALALWAVADKDDAVQLQALLDSSPGLHSLSLSGHRVEYLEDALCQAVRHPATLRHLHLKFEFEQFPTRLIGDALAATGLQGADFEIQYKEESAQASLLQPAPTTDLPRQGYRSRPGMRPGILSKPRTLLPSQTCRFLMERGGDGRVTVPELALPARAFHALAPALARLACIRQLKIGHWEPGLPALAGEIRRSPALLALLGLTLAGQGEFRFADFPLDFSAQSELRLEFERLDLNGFGVALGDTRQLRALHLKCQLSAAAARELLHGLRDNASLTSLSARFDFAEMGDRSLAIDLIGAVLKHPTLSQATITVDSLLHRGCQKLQANNRGIALKFENRYCAGVGPLARTLQPEAEELLRDLIRQFAADPQPDTELMLSTWS